MSFMNLDLFSSSMFFCFGFIGAIQDAVQDPCWLDNSDSDSNEDISVVPRRTPQRRVPLTRMSNEGDSSLVVKGN